MPVTVFQAGGQWTISGRKQTIVLNQSNLALEVRTGATGWAMVPSGTNDMAVRFQGQEFPLRLADADRIAVTRYDVAFKTGVKILLSEWRRPGPEQAPGKVDLTL